ncbi:hypothetical protein CVT25_005386 [Psilocybe cyanescens]|uniref:Uncharacterized protein n=1 Tax=Psilocybe cyanescens TaxID=93625 RepID=A0A409XDZ2_PSICY|nr:hypothetical protein CVT25_005386 [Psilocybe cyanescens]
MVDDTCPDIVYSRFWYSRKTSSYSIDGGTPANFSIDLPVPTDTSSNAWSNISLFQSPSPPQGSHRLEVTFTDNSPDFILALALQYLVVRIGTEIGLFISTPSATSPTASSPPASSLKSHTPIGAIVDGVMGGLALISIALIIYLWSRRHRRNIPSQGLDPDLLDELVKPLTLVEPYTLPRSGSTNGPRPLEASTPVISTSSSTWPGESLGKGHPFNFPSELERDESYYREG